MLTLESATSLGVLCTGFRDQTPGCSDNVLVPLPSTASCLPPSQPSGSVPTCEAKQFSTAQAFGEGISFPSIPQWFMHDNLIKVHEAKLAGGHTFRRWKDLCSIYNIFHICYTEREVKDPQGHSRMSLKTSDFWLWAEHCFLKTDQYFPNVRTFFFLPYPCYRLYQLLSIIVFTFILNELILIWSHSYWQQTPTYRFDKLAKINT